MASYDDTATVSGSIAYFSDGADEVPCKSVKVTLPASLDGYNSASVENSGKNLLDYADITNSYRVTSLTDNGGGSFTVVASGLGAYIDHVIKVKAGQAYTIKCTSATNDEGNASQIGVVNVYDGSDDTANLLLNGASISYSQKVFTPTGNYILVRNKVTGGSGAGTGTIVEPQLEAGASASSYVPYIAPTTYSANLGRTIHGGEVDLVNGEGKETHGKKVFDGTEGTGGTPSWTMISVSQGTMFRITVSDKVTTSATNTLCSYYTPVAQAQRADGTVSGAGTNVDIIDNRFSSVDAFKAWLAENPVTLVYELDTPENFTFTGQEVPTRLGYNAFWSEQGDSEVTYYKDGYGFTSVTVNKQQSKNLFEAFTKGYSINSSTGAIVRSNAAAISNYIRVSEGVRYSLTGLTSTIHSFISYYKVDKTTWISRTSGNNKTELINFTPPTGAMFALVCQYATGTDAGSISDIDGLQTQFEMGEVASEYEPYEAISKTAKLHRIVYGGTADVVKGTCEPKNLLDDNKRVFTAKNIIFGRDSGGRDDFCLKLKAGTYTFSVTTADGTYTNLYLKNSDTKESISGFPAYATSSKSFTLAEDTNCAVFVYKSDYTSVSDITSAQIEKGSSASEYVPHFDPFSFPPISMETDEGENTLFANEGASAITYRKAVD